MYLPFEQIADTARIWIYQSNRAFTAAEQADILKRSEAFISEWTAHGSKLSSSVAVYHHQFLVMAVNEEAGLASGCSIDSAVRFIKSLEPAFGLNFFDRSQVAFFVNDQIVLMPLQKIKEKVAEGHIQENTRVFNNLIGNKTELQSQWLIPAKDSWLKKYF